MTFPMPPAANGSSPNSLTGSRSLIGLQDDDGNQVTFDFNPKEISLSHNTSTQAVPTTKQTSQTHATTPHGVSRVSQMMINIQGLVLVGSDVKNRCEQLLAWTFPKGQDQQAQLPPLRLSWGALSFKDHVKLTGTDIRYQRFAADGMPIRAMVVLKLYWLDPPALPTNPSSGGLPGRQSHTVVAGENLQQIATSRYGRPAAWR